jgi:O-antigen/teichoic acid export membrane protein
MSERREAVRSVRALASATLGAKALGFGAQLVLARLLFEAEFGLFAFAIAITTLLGTLANFESRRDILREPARAPSKARAYAAVQMCIGAALGALLLLASGGLVELLSSLSHAAGAEIVRGGENALRSTLQERERILFLQLCALVPLLEGLRLPTLALAESRGRFRALAGVEFGASALQVSLSCSLALAGFGPFSLLVGFYASILLRLAGSLVLAGRELRSSRAGRAEYLSVLRFGAPLLAANLLIAWFWKMDDILVASVLGLAAGGLYSIAFELPRALLQVAESLSRVSLSLLGRHESGSSQARIFGVTVRASFALLAPALPLALLHGESMLRLLFGARWAPATAPFQLLLLLAVLRGTLRPWADIASSRGRPELITYASLATALLLPIFGLVLMGKMGLTGMALAVLLSWCAPAPFYLLWVRKELDLRFAPLLLPGFVATILSLGAGAALLALPLPTTGTLTADLARIPIMGVQLTVFALVLARLDRELVQLLREGLPARLGGLRT